MNRRAAKKKILAILEHAPLEKIPAELCQFRLTELVNTLFSALCASSVTVRWHAVYAFGQLVPAVADKEMESARVIMRRFLWSLNDESGGIGWGAPEAMAEIMAQHTALANEYQHMLISYLREDGDNPFEDGNYLELPMLQRGLLWGIGRLSMTRKTSMQELGVVDDLPKYLDSEDHVVRGLAVWCLGLLGSAESRGKISSMKGDLTQIDIFIAGEIRYVTVDTIVCDYLAMEVGT